MNGSDDIEVWTTETKLKKEYQGKNNWKIKEAGKKGSESFLRQERDGLDKRSQKSSLSFVFCNSSNVIYPLYTIFRQDRREY